MSRRRLGRPLRRGRPKLGLGLAALGGGGAPLLYAKYNGGKELRTSSGVLSRDADDFFLDPDTGGRIPVAPWVGEGDAVGVPQLYNGPTGPIGVCVGLPMTGQRTGFDSFSASDYFVITFDTTELSFVCHHAVGATPGTGEGLIDSDTSDPRFLVAAASPASTLRVRTVDTAVITDALVTSAFTAATEGYVAGAVSGSGGNVDGYAYDATGALINSDTQTTTAFDVSGIHTLGTNVFGNAWSGTVHQAIGHDGSYLSGASIQAEVDDLEAGDDIDTIRATYSPELATDGAHTGLEPSDANLLVYETGAGASCTAEYA